GTPREAGRRTDTPDDGGGIPGAGQAGGVDGEGTAAAGRYRGCATSIILSPFSTEPVGESASMETGPQPRRQALQEFGFAVGRLPKGSYSLFIRDDLVRNTLTEVPLVGQGGDGVTHLASWQQP